MRILQIVLPDASHYERKCQSIDANGLGAAHEVQLGTFADAERFDVVHLYGSPAAVPGSTRSLRIPYVTPAAPPRRRWFLLRPPGVRWIVVSPLRGEESPDSRVLPEAVSDEFWIAGDRVATGEREMKRIGSFVRPGVRNLIDQTESRIERFRSDVQWQRFEKPPSPHELDALDLWIDPAVDELDFDGFTAEALVAGLPVVASRTPLNFSRLEKGRSGFLVPPGDPNEMTHAILTALFKRELAAPRQSAAQQTIGRFRPRQRIRTLLQIYQSLFQ